MNVLRTNCRINKREYHSKTKKKKIIISGGGISGLTLAALLKEKDVECIVFERFDKSAYSSIGGGIGLWPPAMRVLECIPGVREQLLEKGAWMASPSYRDQLGNVLAESTDSFNDRFPVLCLNRDDLMNVLLDCLKDCVSVEYRTGEVKDYLVGENEIDVRIVNGESIKGDMLIAADGIHSPLRNQLMKNLDKQRIDPLHLGYTYFRANVAMDDTSPWHDISFETWGESNGVPVRFGYVPLKKPHVFWFMAIQTGENTIPPISGVQECDQVTKDWILKQLKNWTGPKSPKNHLKVDYETLIKKTGKILRTDIQKIPNVTKFPWFGHDGKVVLLGDSAHATAPNIAQGAGLCIEDAAVLAHIISNYPLSMMNSAMFSYEMNRKPRARTVQFFADTVAFMGGLKSPRLIRNLFMKMSHRIAPSLHKMIFEMVVSMSLGGDSGKRSWVPPLLETSIESKNILKDRSILGKVLSTDEFDTVADVVRKFKTSSVGGSGKGTVSVEIGKSIVSKIVASVSGLPKDMNELPFEASVTIQGENLQKWTRVFGIGTPLEKAYSTTHSVQNRTYNSYLSEGIGGIFDWMVRFEYDIEVRQTDKALLFNSIGISVFNIPLPLPRLLLPKSVWIETPTKRGWMFDGEISIPLFGRLMKYYGEFEVNEVQTNQKRVIIAGGTGLLGKALCSHFSQNGWDVCVLSRTPQIFSPYKILHWDVKTGDGWHEFIDSNTVIINLAGSNPGAQRWTEKTKRGILESRLSAIKAISDAIGKSTARGDAPQAYLQASAAGIFGDSEDKEMDEDSLVPSPDNFVKGTRFRVESCIDIEEAAKKVVEGKNTTSLSLLRIGHVLSKEGGLFPYINLASAFRANKLGNGTQYIPWIHIDDFSGSLCQIASDPSKYQGPVHVVAPSSVTNKEFMRALAVEKNRIGCQIPVPSSILNPIIGESSCILFDSERLVPKKLSQFQFKYPKIDKAIKNLN